jgi:hypothetical protein
LGCGSARFVQVDGDGGVVAIRNNSNVWPTYYRDKADALIRQRCPAGYEIVREEEIVTGQVADTDTQSNTRQSPTLLLGGTDSDRTKSNRGDYRSEALGAIAIPTGETEQTTHQTTHYRDVTEWRISYRKKPGTATGDGSVPAGPPGGT